MAQSYNGEKKALQATPNLEFNPRQAVLDNDVGFLTVIHKIQYKIVLYNKHPSHFLMGQR